MKKIDKGTFIRTVLFFIAMINQLLIAYGHVPIPLTEAEIGGAYTVGSTIFTAVVSVWAWWKNNYLSKRGLAQKELLKKKQLMK
ncbi:phage holin [Priestia megaterium]|uniref:phage holin n=1 Tax=Priestia megaterium TaxID=1404 RepID=UPI002E238BC8|nr:phage holin [Priestia megaterium]MED4240654.1 phage holin [Priestia megaterium]